MTGEVTLEQRAEIYRLAYLQQVLTDRQIRNLESQLHLLKDQKEDIDRRVVMAKHDLLTTAQTELKTK